MKKLIKKTVILLVFTLTAFSGLTLLHSQSIQIMDVVVPENTSFVEVPIMISVPDSAAAIQFSILWPPEKLRLDSLLLSPILQNGRFSVVANQLEDREIRIVVLPVLGVRDLLMFEEDSAAFTLSFELMADFKGYAEVVFNPDFPAGFSSYSNYIPATVQNGNISYPGEVTSSQNTVVSASNIKVSPNPVRNQLRIDGFAAGDRFRPVHLIDNLGRRCWSGKLTEAAVELPEGLANGLYWLIIELEAGICTRRVVLLR